MEDIESFKWIDMYKEPFNLNDKLFELFESAMWSAYKDALNENEPEDEHIRGFVAQAEDLIEEYRDYKRCMDEL